MKLFAGFTVLVAASSGLAQDFLIDTPIGGVLQCVPIEIVWVGGTGPFDLIFTSDVVDALQIYRKIPKSPFLWSANVTAGTRLVMSLLDEANGNESISGNFSVSDSGNSSCLNRDSSSTSSKLGSTDRESHTSSATSTTISSGSLTTGTPSIDSAGITASSGGTSQSSPLPSSGAANLQSSPTHHLSGGAIGGIVAGVVLFILLLAVLIAIMRRKRQQRNKEFTLETTAEPYDATQGQTQMAESSSGAQALATRERTFGEPKFLPRQPSPTPLDSASSLQPSSQSSRQDESVVDESNPLVPSPVMTDDNSRAVHDSAGGRPTGSDITVVERITRALGRITTREEQPPGYEE